MEKLNHTIPSERLIYDSYENNVNDESDRENGSSTNRTNTYDQFSDDEEYIEEEKNISYTEIYRKYKEKHKCMHTYNKLPVHSYVYPRNVSAEKFRDLKDEIIKEKIKKRKEQKRHQLRGNKGGTAKEEMEDNDDGDVIYHDADLKIYTPKNFSITKQKTLREKIYDGEVMFYDDYIEQKTAADYERFFKKPYIVKRQDEGGEYFFFGKKLQMTQEEDIYRKYYNLDEEYFVNKLKIKNSKKREEHKLLEKTKSEKYDEEYESLNYRDKYYLLKLEKENEKNKSNLTTYGFYKNNKNIIFNQNLSEIKKKELIKGKIPEIILPITIRKKKHPQHCTVPFSRLQNYAISLENLKICPYIHKAVDEELTKNWKILKNNNMDKLRPERPKKGYKKDIYVVTKENLEKSKEKLKSFLEKNQVEEEPVSFKNISSIKYQKKEREKLTVSGGRYVV